MPLLQITNVLYLIVPLCPENIPNGEITGTCSFLQRAECAYNCDRFYIATTSNNRVTCIEGIWDEQTPCVFSSKINADF